MPSTNNFYLCSATGRKNPRSRKVVHLYKKIWTIFRADGQSGLVCLDAIRGAVHIGRMSIALSPVQRLSFDRQVPAFFIWYLLNLESNSNI